MSAPLAPTISLHDATARTWDLIVVGAGPAGSLCALLLARSGRSILLLDQQNFPRPKVCGGCLNGVSLDALNRAGLASLVSGLGASPIHRLRWTTDGWTADVDLPEGRAVSRASLDHALIKEATNAGADFLPRVHAVDTWIEGDVRKISVREDARALTARAVIVASGLGGSFLSRDTQFRVVADPDSRLGVGCVMTGAPAFYTPGTIFMASTTEGYVGLVRVENNELDVAAAIDRDAIRSAGGSLAAVNPILARAGWPALAADPAETWHGTGALTQSRECVAGERIFLVGDATGYVEPFTGEGMGWAMSGAHLLAPIASAACLEWRAEWAARWTALHTRHIRNRQAMCGRVMRLLRSGRLSRAACGLLSRFPGLAAPWVERINRPPAEFS